MFLLLLPVLAVRCTFVDTASLGYGGHLLPLSARRNEGFLCLSKFLSNDLLNGSRQTHDTDPYGRCTIILICFDLLIEKIKINFH